MNLLQSYPVIVPVGDTVRLTDQDVKELTGILIFLSAIWLVSLIWQTAIATKEKDFFYERGIVALIFNCTMIFIWIIVIIGQMGILISKFL